MKAFMNGLLFDLRAFDYWLALLVTVLSVFGVMMIHAVAGLQPRYAALPAQQQFHVITGVVVMLIVAFVDHRLIAKFYVPIYVLCLGLLAAVLIIGPDDITGTARWIVISLPGIGSTSIQPSEFAKIFLIVSLSGFVYIRGNINHILWLPMFVILAAVPVMMVMMQPSLSAGMVLLAISLAILFIAGIYFRTIIIGTILVLPIGILLYLDMLRENPLFVTSVLSDRQWQRIQTFLDPHAVDADAVLQMNRSLFAIGSGGLNGKGFMQNDTWVIHGHNDFVFAVAAEQFGFIGSMILLGVTLAIIVKCFFIAYNAEDMLGRLLAGGVAGMLLFQAFVNVGVVTGLLPNTGMPFPFMSYGGTHMWTHMAAIGLVLNVGICKARAKREEERD